MEVSLPNVDDAVKFSKDFTIGATAAVIAKAIVAPIERVKLILQLQASQPTIPLDKRYNGMIDCFIRVPREQGFFSFWRGNWSNILRASSQESLGWAFKEYFKIWCLYGVDPNTWNFVLGNLASGGLSGVATFCFIYPLDFTRTRLAVDIGKDKASREFRGLLDCIMKVKRREGFFGLYRGFFPSAQYIFLYRAAYYGLFDAMKFRVERRGKKINFTEAFCIGQLTTLVASIISYPWDTVRRRLMMQSGQTVKQYSGSWDCTRQIYYKEGPRAFFNGLLVNCIRGISGALVLAICSEVSKYS